MSETRYIVMIPNHWGRGQTPLEAANVARSVAGKRKGMSMPKPRVVFSYDPEKTTEAYVDEMGRLCWMGEKPNTVETVLTKR